MVADVEIAGTVHKSEIHQDLWTREHSIAMGISNLEMKPSNGS